MITERLELLPVTVSLVEAVLAGDRARLEGLVNARCPVSWPNRALIERAFYADVEAIKQDPTSRLWGDRVMITRGETRRVVGSVDLGAKEAGRHNFEWALGSKAADAGYTFRVAASLGKAAVTGRTLVVDRVQSVSTAGDALTLTLARSGTVPASAVVAYN